jgi:hypothetical protein
VILRLRAVPVALLINMACIDFKTFVTDGSLPNAANLGAFCSRI